MKQLSQQPDKVGGKNHTVAPRWVFWEADSEVEIEVQKSARECSWDQHWWKGRERSRIGQGEAKLMIQPPPEAPADPAGGSEDG